MPNDSLKITRNFRGGVLRMIRIAAACALLYFGVHALAGLTLPANPGYDPHMHEAAAAFRGIVAGCAIVLAVFWLWGTLLRAIGVVLTVAMIPFVVIGYLLTLAGAPEITRRLPMAYLLVGCTLLYTGRGEWTLIPFAIRQMRESLAQARAAS